MPNFLKDFFIRASYQPVLLGGFALALEEAAFPHLGSAWKVTVTAGISLLQKMYSTSMKHLKEQYDSAHADGYSAAVADVNALAAPPTPQI